MGYPLRGECERELAGKTYKLKLDFGDFEELDADTQLGPWAMLQNLLPHHARLPLLIAVLRRAIRGDDDKPLPLAKVRVIVSQAGFVEALDAAVAILRLCLTDPRKVKDGEEGNADAPEEGATTATSG